MPLFDQLPYEILFSIIVEFSILSQGDIFNLLLVNRHVKTTVRPLLFRTLDLSVNDINSKWTAHGCEQMEGWGPFSEERAIRATLFYKAVTNGNIKPCDINKIRHLRISQDQHTLFDSRDPDVSDELATAYADARLLFYQHLTGLKVLKYWRHYKSIGESGAYLQ